MKKNIEEITEEELRKVPLIDLARMIHVCENSDDDIGLMRISDEVHRRVSESDFRKFYLQVWPEFQKPERRAK